LSTFKRPPRRKLTRKRVKKKGRLGSLALLLLVLYLAFLIAYVLILKRSNVGGTGWYIASLAKSSPGVNLGVFTLSYPSVAILVVLSIATLISALKGIIHFSAPRIAVVFIIGLVLGALMGGAYSAGEVWPYHVQVSSGGFSLTVYYSSTTLILGKNFTVKYVARDVSYKLTTPYYYFFGAQFSMVFYNSTGDQIVGFRAPITFNLSASNYIITLEPGEVWSTLLVWNGTIIGANGTRSVAKPGIYQLASYAVFQDANVSLYVELQAPNISVTVVAA
jgi:hypothetical protein